MILAALGLGLVAFVAVLRLTHAADVASRVVSTAFGSIEIISNADLSDDDKEARIRQASICLFKLFGLIACIGTAAIAAPAVILWGGSAIGLYDLDRAIAVAVSWPFLLGSTLFAVLLYFGLERRRFRRTSATRGTETQEEVPYSPLDKALHTYAFASPGRQRVLGELETKLYGRRIAPGHAERPVFVTSLPRAGTTIMLEALSRMPEFSSATYRHMPFTLSPLLWGGFSGAFRKAGTTSERAHGDGIEVGFDSPEAFEEMIWMAFWPEHYRDRHILPWATEARAPEFERFFRTHMAKIVATKPGAHRYLSKNNANIARLGLIRRLFPDAAIVIPIRDPRAQVASLMRQHARFTELHAREPFARQYMEGIGHFEFGGALKPIDFDGSGLDPAAATGPDFWLRYWISAYEAVLREASDGAVFVDHDALCDDPDRHLPLLAEAISVDDTQILTKLAETFHPQRPAPDLPGADPALLARAMDLHTCLQSRALMPATTNTRMEITA